MEPKKNHKANLERKRPMFFCIGLLISISFVITAFEWRSVEKKHVIDYFPIEDVEPPTMIPPTVIKPPEIKKIIQPIIKEAEPDEVVEDILAVFEIPIDDPVVVIEFQEPPKPTPVDQTFIFLEDSANFPGGQDAFTQYLSKKLRYPKAAQRAGIEGKVFLQFVVMPDGSIDKIKVLKGIGFGCDEEAVRVLQASPHWNPGKQRAVPVKQQMSFCINFKLN